jgi:hypothetical protein
LYFAASDHHRSTISRSFSGSAAARSTVLGEVDGHVEQLPRVLVEGQVRIAAVVPEEGERVEHHCLPAVVVDGPGPEHLVVLRDVAAGGGGVGERRGEAHALDRRLGHAADRARGLDADQLEQRRQHVDGVHVLVADLAGPAETGGPVDDERIGDAALVRLALPPPQRCVAGPGPRPWVVTVGARRAEVVDAAQVLLEALGLEVEEVHLVVRAVGAALGAGAVVAHHEHDRVVELAEDVDVIDEAAQLGVGVLEEAGVHLHHAGVQHALVARERVPRRHPMGPFGERRPRRQQSRRQLTGVDLFAPGVPTLVEAAAIPLDVVGGRLVR